MIYNRVEIFKTFKTGKPMPFDRTWFQNRLKDVEVSQRQLAKHLGLSGAVVKTCLKGVDNSAHVAIISITQRAKQ